MGKYNCSFIIGCLFLYSASFYSCSEAEGDESEVKLTAITSLERIGLNEPLFGESQVVIKAAKNEYESFQVVIGAIEKNVQVINAEISDLSGDNGIIEKKNVIMYRPDYVRIAHSTPRAQLPPGLYPDPLVPFKNPHTGEAIKPFRTYTEYWQGPRITEGHKIYPLPFEIWKGQNQTVWVDVFIPENAAAGDYKGTFTITLENYPGPWGSGADTLKTKTVSIPVELTVWDFILPDGPTYRNHFGGVGNLTSWFNADYDSDAYREIEMNYCRMFADHRLNPPLPHHLMPAMNEDGSLDINPENHQKLKTFLKEFHVTDFEIPRTPIPEINNSRKKISEADKRKIVRYYADYYRYVKENGWEERAYVYLYDEPNTQECYSRVLELGELVKEASPQLKILVVEQPYKQDPSWPDMDPAIDIWCGLLGFIDRNSTNSAIARGDEVWSYTALAQRTPAYHPQYDQLKNYDPPYWHIDAGLTAHRTPVWINYQYGISGILYWALTYRERDDWNPVFRLKFNGDGYFMYPGVPCGIDGPVSSIRLKNIRESMEDYEYLHLYEKLAGREAVLKVVAEVAPEWWESTNDADVIYSAREKIANEIIKLANH